MKLIISLFNNKFNFRLWGMLAIIAVFIGLSVWSEPLPFTVNAQTTPTPQPVILTATLTALPPELLDTQSQSNGIIMGSIVLILIVLISTTLTLRTRNRLEKENKKPGS